MIYRDGQQTGSLRYDDVIDAMMRGMETSTGFTGLSNLGNASDNTMPQLAKLPLKMTGSRSQGMCMPLAADDSRKRRPEVSLVVDGRCWTPKVGLEDGL